MKSKYERPHILNLGESAPLSLGQIAACDTGSAVVGTCSNGETAGGGCVNGNWNITGLGCDNGNNNAGAPGYACQNGNNNLTGSCSGGSNVTG